MFGTWYTFSKALGEASSETGYVSPYFDPRHRNYGPLSFNRAQLLTIAYGYDFLRLNLPGGKVSSAIVNGWTLSGIISFSTGAPLSPTMSLSPSLDITSSSTGSTGDTGRPTILCDTRNRTKTGTSQIFNASCFGMTSVGSFGNAGVGYLTGPGFQNWEHGIGEENPDRTR